MNQLNWYMARRYFFAKRGNRFVSWVGGISIIGIALGVIALIITLAVLNGFEREVTLRIANFIPHVIIDGKPEPADLKKLLPPEAEIYRSTERKALIEVNNERQVLNVRAVDLAYWDHLLEPEAYAAVSPGRLKRLAEELPGMVVGNSLANSLFLSVGDTVVLKSPLDIQTGLFRIPQRHFVVTGIFRSEIFDFDRSLGFIDYGEGRRLFKAAGRDRTHIQLTDFNDAATVKQNISAAFPDLLVSTWHDQHKTLFDAMRMEKWGSFIGLNMIILVAVFNIVSSLMMLVLEKTGDIGILRVMGAPTSSIRDIFNLQGYIIAFLGVVLGVFMGTSLVVSQASWGWITLPEDIYLIPVLPVHMIWSEVILIGVVAFSIVLLSIRYPANKAAALLPLDAINYKR